jgi:hypothetical protein
MSVFSILIAKAIEHLPDSLFARLTYGPSTTKTFDRIDGIPIRWIDENGLIHAVEGVEVRSGDRLFWLKCEEDKVPAGTLPAGALWTGTDPVTCPDCAEAESAR